MWTYSAEQVFKDDGGVYILGPLGNKVYATLKEGGTVLAFDLGPGGIWGAFVRAITLSIQHFDNKTPIINGQPAAAHVSILADDLPGGPATLLEFAKGIGSVHNLKKHLPPSWKCWCKGGGVFVKDAAGQPHSFPTFDAAWDWFKSGADAVAAEVGA